MREEGDTVESKVAAGYGPDDEDAVEGSGTPTSGLCYSCMSTCVVAMQESSRENNLCQQSLYSERMPLPLLLTEWSGKLHLEIVYLIIL